MNKKKKEIIPRNHKKLIEKYTWCTLTILGFFLSSHQQRSHTDPNVITLFPFRCHSTRIQVESTFVKSSSERRKSLFDIFRETRIESTKQFISITTQTMKCQMHSWQMTFDRRSDNSASVQIAHNGTFSMNKWNSWNSMEADRNICEEMKNLKIYFILILSHIYRNSH